MPRLPVLSGKDLVTVLKKAGFSVVRQKGSHISLQKHASEKVYRTVVPLHQEIAKGTLLDIIHQTGLSKDGLLKLLKK
ncbi:MAG: type II toxin-antitoxin system HicA family toxin [Candidatus Aenigmarchaeota archaeon]|nr:type II toxin-antitoxin system HicA family toxin [Candidatus Aenigmarchaeota archaeon]MCK5333761.1 type II toxin-antitoxin system HicA family toxin [Candidatus Aenigmarchaeota archaeon]